MEWPSNPEDKLTGICTLFWVGIAIFLLISQWLPDKRHDIQALVMITLLSGAGYVVGRTIAALGQRDWVED
jgi:hypothetical protein